MGYDGKRRSGRVVYIHPDRIFAVLEFEVRLGNWRESIMLSQPGRYCKDIPSEIIRCEGYRHKGARYTAAEDAEILQSDDLAGLAKKLGRTERSVIDRKQVIRRKNEQSGKEALAR